MTCHDCGYLIDQCKCDYTDMFNEENHEVMDDLKELELRDAGEKRCNACCRYACECAKGRLKYS